MRLSVKRVGVSAGFRPDLLPILLPANPKGDLAEVWALFEPRGIRVVPRLPARLPETLTFGLILGEVNDADRLVEPPEVEGERASLVPPERLPVGLLRPNELPVRIDRFWLEPKELDDRPVAGRTVVTPLPLLNGCPFVTPLPLLNGCPLVMPLPPEDRLIEVIDRLGDEEVDRTVGPDLLLLGRRIAGAGLGWAERVGALNDRGAELERLLLRDGLGRA